MLVGPAKMPPELVRRLHAEMEKALGKPDNMGRLLADGSGPMSGTPEQLAAFLKAEHARWGGVVKDAAVKLD